MYGSGRVIYSMRSRGRRAVDAYRNPSLILRSKAVPVDRARLAQFNAARVDLQRILLGAFNARRHAR